jgi:hypothetical protein
MRKSTLLYILKPGSHSAEAMHAKALKDLCSIRIQFYNVSY